MLWPKYPVCYDSPHIPVCKTHLQCWDWSTKVLLWALVIHPHTHTHIHILYTHTHTQSSDGASGSATMFPGSLTGLMEALCLKPGQTAADSRGDAYQLLAMLRPRGEREGEREGERDKERERKRERGGYSKMHCIKKEPASVWKLGWNSAHLNTPAWHFKSRQVFFFFFAWARYWHGCFTAAGKRLERILNGQRKFRSSNALHWQNYNSSVWDVSDNSGSGGHMRVLAGRVMYGEALGDSPQWHAKGQQGARPLQVWPLASVPKQTPCFLRAQPLLFFILRNDLWQFKIICSSHVIFHTDRYCKVVSDDRNNKKWIQG